MSTCSENQADVEGKHLTLAGNSTKALTVRSVSLAARGLRDLRTTEEAQQWFKKGFELHAQRQFDEAFECFERGGQLDPDVWLVLDGRCVEGDKIAQDRFIRAGNVGLADEQMRLGYMCEVIEIAAVEPDYPQAAFWYRKAAEQGNVHAQYNLGSLYYRGQGVRQDYAQAMIWYRKAAERGQAQAYYVLGLMYFEGQGVMQDYSEAYFWLDLEVAGNVEGPQRTYAMTCRDESALRLTPIELLRSQARVNEWLDNHIDIRAGLVPRGSTYTPTVESDGPMPIKSAAIELDRDDIDNPPDAR